jgi:hypothetical protein
LQTAAGIGLPGNRDLPEMTQEKGAAMMAELDKNP